MPLPWVRLDTTLPHNHKILALVEAKKHPAALAYVFGLAYSGDQGTDGFIPRVALPFIHATPRIAADLVDVGLWLKDQAGWYVPDWADFQPTASDTDDLRAKRRSASKIANCVRWHGQECGCWRNPP